MLLQVLGHICYHILASGLNGYMATVTNLKNPVNKWRCGAAPITVGFLFLHWVIHTTCVNDYPIKINFRLVFFTCLQAMMTVKRYGRGHGASTLGKPALHPATVDLKGKAYEYVISWWQFASCLVNPELENNYFEISILISLFHQFVFIFFCMVS